MINKTYKVDRLKWSKMGILDQMGNISSEVGRAINAKKQDNAENLDKAVERALDLFDATTDSLVSSKSVRSKEVLRSKDQFLMIIRDSKPSISALDNLEKYFSEYAIAARINK